MFGHCLGGEVRKLFKDITANSIDDLLDFHQNFINRWEVKKNPLQILLDYETIKRSLEESV